MMAIDEENDDNQNITSAGKITDYVDIFKLFGLIAPTNNNDTTEITPMAHEVARNAAISKNNYCCAKLCVPITNNRAT